MVTGYVPAATEADAASPNVAEFPVVLAGAGDNVRPDGAPVIAKATLPLNPSARVTLIVPGAQAEPASDALEAEGAVSTDLADADADTAGERAIFAEPGGEAPLWDRCRLTALFPEETDVSAALERTRYSMVNASIDHIV